MISFASGMLWELTFAEHSWYGMTQPELTELLFSRFLGNMTIPKVHDARASWLHWSSILIAPRYVTEVPCLSCLGAMVQFLGSKLPKKKLENWRQKFQRWSCKKNKAAWSQQTYDGTRSWFAAFNGAIYLVSQVCSPLSTSAIASGLPWQRSQNMEWNGKKKERMFRCFSAKCALALG